MKMCLDELRSNIAIKQKKRIAVYMCLYNYMVIDTNCNIVGLATKYREFACALLLCPLLPISWTIGKILKVDIFDKSNPLGNVGFLFTCNQFLYLLIVMWVFNAVPDKMVMVYAMVFGAHLLPYSWLYKSISYRIFAIIIPVLSLVIGCIFSALFIALTLILVECIFAAALFAELGRFTNK
ncbi:MAG: DUF7010 family protein [Ruminococcus sp.]|uniref:DUF7010 family protein n=2 Tax=Ruminococcus sp. TaxID=41978 RepID=UPI00399C1E59